MPIHDVICPHCRTLREDVYLPFTNSGLPPCEECGRETERVWSTSFSKGVDTYPYVTKNIRPDGKPVEVKSPGHLKSLCKRYGVTQRDDTAWVEQEWLGYDYRTKQQKYREGSGLGRPGCWV